MRTWIQRATLWSVVLAAGVSFSGCAALGRLAHFPETPQVYGGTRTHIKNFPLGQVLDYNYRSGPGGGAKMGAGIIFLYTFWWFPADVALSFGIDTAALPVTLWTLLQDEPPEEDPPKRTPRSVSLPDGSETIVAPDSVWKWLHPTDGTDPAASDPDFHTTFHRLDFDPSTWSSGRDQSDGGAGFGYGDPVRTHIGEPPSGLRHSAYFRHVFETERLFTQLTLEFRCDDGAIAYLDGKEVARMNMRDGPEAYKLPAAVTRHAVVRHVDSELRVSRLSLAADLPPGQHVLAISLHNSGVGSSDLTIGAIRLSGVPD